MGIAAQLGEVEQLREIRLEIGEEVTSYAAIASRRADLQVGRESLNIAEHGKSAVCGFCGLDPEEADIRCIPFDEPNGPDWGWNQLDLHRCGQ